MFKKDIAIYLGAEQDKGFTGFLSEENFFAIIVVEDGLTKEEGQKFLTEIKTELILKKIDNLSDFEIYLSEKIKERNLPITLSLSAGLIKDNILYLKTINQGEVYIFRKGKLALIIKGNLSASGYIHPNDLFIFTTASFTEKLGATQQLKNFLDSKKPSELVDLLTPILKSKEDKGIIALFVQFKKEEEIILKDSIIEKIVNVYKTTILSSQKIGRKKTINFLAVVVIFFILVWSVGFGYQRRREALISKKINSVRSLIEDKLNQADESSFFSIKKSKSLIEEAKKELFKLEKELGQRKEFGEIKKLIEDRENKIIKKEEKKAEEFFDLAIDNKQAKGEKIYLNEDLLMILDNQQGSIYNLSLTKKSLEKINFEEIKKAKLIASYKNEVVFYLPQEGLYKTTTTGEKLKKIIDKDKDWGNIVDFWIYNGNLYLLDEGRNEIYKYLVTEEGYSNKTSYFKGRTYSLKDANSLAIDASVYVGFEENIIKFTTGIQDEFKTSFPENTVHLRKIFTTKDLEKIYVWDKLKGVIYVLKKNGTYEREIASDILKKTSDFVVYQTNAYILVGGKIYKLSLE